MRFLSPTVHGVLDYLVVATLFAAPAFLGFTGLELQVCWALACVHLAITVLTAFPMGIFGVLPFTIHGWIELVVAPSLVALPFVLGFDEDARNFFVVLGIVVGGVWAVTRYDAAAAPAPSPG